MIALPKLFAGNKVNPNVFQAAISRFLRRAAPKKPAEQPPQRRKILFESLEPRVLMSADFMPVAPLGGLIQQANSGGNLANADAVASETFSLDAGQKISVVFSSEDPDLRGMIQLYDVTGGGESLLASASAANPGEMALLDSYSLGTAGDFRLDVRNLNAAGDGGAFNLAMFLNATVELEAAGMGGNDALANAQSLAASELALPGGGQRYAAVGTLEAGNADYFKLHLLAGDVLDFGLASAAAGVTLELRDASDTVIALGASAGTEVQAIQIGRAHV